MMHAALFALAGTLFSGQVAAFLYAETGIGLAPREGYATFANAAQHPNVLHSVSFAHYYDNGRASISTNPQLNNWTWTVSVSDVYMPNTTSSNKSLTNVAYLTYGFSWPEQGSINSALAAENKNNAQAGDGFTSCAFLITALFPDSISKKWDGTSDCSSALGSNCTATLMELIGSSSSGDDCHIGFSISDPKFLSACSTSFNSTQGGSGLEFAPGVFGNASAPMNGTALQKNQTYAFFVSEPYAAGNMTLYNQTANNLQVLALTGSHTNLLCNRAGDGKSLSSAGSVHRMGTAIVVPLAVLVGLLISW